MLPPVNPDTTSVTPSNFSKSDSMHQKQPPAKIASSAFVDGVKAEALNAVLIKTAESVNFIIHLLCVGLTL
jgi:hypothetical protein